LNGKRGILSCTGMREREREKEKIRKREFFSPSSSKARVSAGI